MKISKACAIFLNIGSKDYSLEEKGAAIKMVCDMPTHNGITKDRMLDVIRWLLNLMYITEVKHENTNADRIRAMSNEELAQLPKEWSGYSCVFPDRECGKEDSCEKCLLKWLQKPVEETKYEKGYQPYGQEAFIKACPTCKNQGSKLCKECKMEVLSGYDPKED